MASAIERALSDVSALRNKGSRTDTDLRVPAMMRRCGRQQQPSYSGGLHERCPDLSVL